MGQQPPLPTCSIFCYAGSQTYNADQDEAGSDQDSYFDDDDFADGFKVSNVASDSLAMDEDDDDALLDGPQMTNKQYGKAREGARQNLVGPMGIKPWRVCSCYVWLTGSTGWP